MDLIQVVLFAFKMKASALHVSILFGNIIQCCGGGKLSILYLFSFLVYFQDYIM